MRSGSYRIIDPRKFGLAPVIGAAIGGLVIAGLMIADLIQSPPNENSWVVVLIVIVALAMGPMVILHRRELLSQRLVVDEAGLSLVAGEKLRWRIEWSELDSVT